MSSVAQAPAPPSWRPSARRWEGPVTTGALALVGTAVLAVGDPNTTHVPLCPLKAITGLDCPACGSLRAVHSLTRLDVAGALDHNLLFTVAVPALVAAWAIWLLRGLGRPVLARLVVPAWGSATLVAVALTFGVLRNLPALSWLASGA
jgi:hypothetical protein